MLNAVNYTHWRFLASEMWDAIRGYGAQLLPGIPNEVFAGTIVDLVLTGATNYWNVDQILVSAPEWGGVALGCYNRTIYNLKNQLLELEQAHGKDFFYKGACLRLVKESTKAHNQQPFRPWDRFPEGETKKLMETIGSLHGLNHELESFLDKAHNKFILDTKWYKEEIWKKLETNLASLDPSQPPIFNVEDYVCSQRWPGYAIPEMLVSEANFIDPEFIELPFARVQKKTNKFSLIRIIEELLCISNGQPLKIPEEFLSLEGFLLWETPVMPNYDGYQPLCDLSTIGKIADFNDPRRVILDYWARTHSVIVGLKTEDYRAKAAGHLLTKLIGLSGDQRIEEATWYTSVPLPLNEDLKLILKNQLPKFHEQIIRTWIQEQDTSPEQLPNPIDQFTFDYLTEFKKENKKQWAKWTRAKRKSEKKARPTKKDWKLPRDRFPVNVLDVNMDQLDQIITTFTLEDYNLAIQGDTKPTPQPVEVEEPDGNVQSAPLYMDQISQPRFHEVPAWMLEQDSSEAEESYSDEEENIEEYEASLAAMILDRIAEGDHMLEFDPDEV